MPPLDKTKRKGIIEHIGNRTRNTDNLTPTALSVSAWSNARLDVAESKLLHYPLILSSPCFGIRPDHHFYSQGPERI